MSNLVLLFIIIIVLFLCWLCYYLGQLVKEREWKEQIQVLRAQIADKQRAGIKGKISEMFAPYLQGFPYKASECKFIGDPIDYIVFEGLDNRNVTGVHFLDIKTDSSELKPHQKQIKAIIDKKENISFRTFRFKTK